MHHYALVMVAQTKGLNRAASVLCCDMPQTNLTWVFFFFFFSFKYQFLII